MTTQNLTWQHCTDGHDPALGQNHKSFDPIGTFDDFDINLRHYFFHGAAKHRALIAAIGVEFQQERIHSEHGRHDQRAADIQDRDGGALVMATMFGMYPFLLKLYADGGYQGPVFRRAVTKIMTQVNVEIVRRSDRAKGFVVLPKRWVVERTFAWLGRCRRLAKDWENLNRKALAFLRLASIRLMLRKLCNPV